MENGYSSYDYYKETYRGLMNEGEYAACAAKAKREIDIRSDKRAQKAPESMSEALALCECEMADLFYEYSALPCGIKGVNNDGYSVQYESPAAMARKMRDVAERYLWEPVNLLYRGV